MPPGALRSMVSNGPMNDQRRPMPSRIATSTSSAAATPCLTIAQRGADQRGLHAVGDEARDLAVEPDRRLADLPHQGLRAVDHRGVGPRRRAELDQRRHERRVDRMRHEAARAAVEPFGEA